MKRFWENSRRPSALLSLTPNTPPPSLSSPGYFFVSISILEILLRRNPTTHTLQELHPATAQARTARSQKIRLNRVKNTGVFVLGSTESLSMESRTESGDRKVSGPLCTNGKSFTETARKGYKRKNNF